MHFKCSMKKQRLAHNLLRVYSVSDLLFSTHDKFLQALSYCVICRDCRDVLMPEFGTDLCVEGNRVNDLRVCEFQLYHVWNTRISYKKCCSHRSTVQAYSTSFHWHSSATVW